MQEFLSIFFPERCHVCNITTGNEYICKFCIEILYINFDEKRCSKCFDQINSKEESVCNACRLSPPYYNSLKYISINKNKTRNIIQAMKYNPSKKLAKLLGRKLKQKLKYLYNLKDLNNHWDLIIPVPSAQTQYIKRQFNQSEVIAQSCFKKINSKALRHIKKIPPQVSLNFKLRAKNVKNAYQASHIVENKKILLIDDVVSTQATINECSRILLKQNAQQIDVLTFAANIID